VRTYGKCLAVSRSWNAATETQSGKTGHTRTFEIKTVHIQKKITRTVLLPKRLVARNRPKKETAGIQNKAVKTLAESPAPINTTSFALRWLMLRKTATSGGPDVGDKDCGESAGRTTAAASSGLRQPDFTRSVGMAPTVYRLSQPWPAATVEKGIWYSGKLGISSSRIHLTSTNETNHFEVRLTCRP